MTHRDPKLSSPLDPACGPTIEQLQLVLDGELPSIALDADQHLVVCAACRNRTAMARSVLRALAASVELPIPAGLTESILAKAREDRFARVRHRSYAVAGGVAMALAASVVLLAWAFRPDHPPIVTVPTRGSNQARNEPTPSIAPEPRPVRLGDEFSKVGQTLIETSRPISAPAIGAPRILAMISSSLTRPMGPAAELEPARSALAELPDAARSCLEPVTSTTQKAFARLLRDMGGVQVNTKPKS